MNKGMMNMTYEEDNEPDDEITIDLGIFKHRERHLVISGRQLLLVSEGGGGIVDESDPELLLDLVIHLAWGCRR